MSATVTELPTHAALEGVPWVDVAGNLRAAVLSGKNFATMIRELVALRRGPGQLTVAEYFYYRLWQSPASLVEKRRFIGKRVQAAMHLACNDYGWNAVTEDKLVFHSLALAAGLPVPQLLAIVHPTRRLNGVLGIQGLAAAESVLRDPGLYPFFAKPVGGRYSLDVVSADRVDTRGRMFFPDGSNKPAAEVAATFIGSRDGYLIQRRLASHPRLIERLGKGLCSLRLLVLLTDAGPLVSRAVLKIPAPANVADNYWRPGNVIAAVDVASGVVRRSVRGTGHETDIDPEQQATGLQARGLELPDWHGTLDLARDAATLFPGVRTQSWDVALTDHGPVLLEVNWGGDLNLAQLAYGEGVLDDSFQAHLATCGYESRKSVLRARQLGQGLRQD